MTIDELKNQLEELITTEKLDQAEALMLTAAPVLKAAFATDVGSVFAVLELFSSIAGDADSFGHFSTLLEDLRSDDFLTNKQIDDLIRASPANRWF